MTIESFQETLFEDPIGLRFRNAREKARWSQESAAQQLKLPVAVLDAIEREDWARLGAPIFVRSYVGSYAKLLGLPVELADQVVQGKPAPQLVPIGLSSPARRVFDRGLMNLAYLVLTVLIVGAVVMLAMYFQTPHRAAKLLPLDPPAGGFAAAQGEPGQRSGLADTAAMAATMAPLPVAVKQEREVVMHFVGDSWIEVLDGAGSALERGIVRAGNERRFGFTGVSRVTLGDAAAVEVSLAGEALDLAPFREANVARFTVSSEGGVAPIPGG